ncbi:MAG: 6-bladed beta-propeller [Acidobacteriota bacterium]
MRLIIRFILIIFISLNIHGESVRFKKQVKLGDSLYKKKIADMFLGKKKRPLIKPSSITLLNNYNYCITDQSNGVAAILNMKGELIRVFKRNRKIALVSPVSVCTDNKGYIYVSDSFMRSIIKFNDQLKKPEILIFNRDKRITGITVLNEKLFCTDTQNHKILVYNLKGELTNSFGSRGTGDLEFNFPTHIAVDNEYIYITDALNFRIQILDHKGGFVRKFGRNGRRGGDFSKPKGIAVDSKKRIFVTDVMFDNVQIFDINGRFLDTFGVAGSREGEFWMPSGIYINSTNMIYIADTYNNRLQVFEVIKEN